MIFDKIIHATQYYRSPTPLKEEWEGDIKTLGEYNLDTVQIRINWRWNEKEEGVYDFSDVDELMELCEKHDKKVIIKFLLECAPQYIYDKYEGTRIAPDGRKLSPGSHGAFYGGFRPCFTNPFVQARAVKFVEEVAKRYASRKNIIFWNAWNEIRNAPAEECFCPHCRKAFGEYLKNKFGTIEALNEFYGTAEESFEKIALPSMARGYWDIYEFKKFKAGSELYKWLRFVYDAIRKYDKTRPITAHVGCPALYQDTIEDNCEDMFVLKAVDFCGTSVCIESTMDTHARREDYLMLNDYMRSLDENYFVYEIYPGLGMFREYDTPYDMKFKQYAAIACGAKGINYWQWRSERIGHEADCAGLVRMNGKPRPVAEEVKRFGETLLKDGGLLGNAKAKTADFAIVFDYDSSLISAIDDYCVDNSFKRNPNMRGYFHGALKGGYRLLTSGGYAVDFVHTTTPEKFGDYKVLYFPYCVMENEKLAPYIEKFVTNGGIVVADEGFFMRQRNTWMQPYGLACKPVVKAELAERRISNGAETVSFDGKIAKVYPFKTTYETEGAEEIMKFSDGAAAAYKFSYGKGAFYLLGFSLGYGYLKESVASENVGSKCGECENGATGCADCGESKDRGGFYEALLERIADEAGAEKLEFADGEKVYEKRLVSGDKELSFIFNNTTEKKIFRTKNGFSYCGGDGKLCGDALEVPPLGAAYAVKK